MQLPAAAAAAQARQAELQVIPHNLMHLAQAAREAQERPQQLAALASLMLAAVVVPDLNKAGHPPAPEEQVVLAAAVEAMAEALLHLEPQILVAVAAATV